MELIVCLLLASLITGFRPVTDTIQALKGVEPPHLTKARLRAETEKLRLAAKQAKAENRQVRPGEDKPTLRDVARVYWGDALQDVIDAHNKHRAAKKARAANPDTQPAKSPSLTRRIWDLIARPVGEPQPDTAQPVQDGDNRAEPVEDTPGTERPDGPVITCDTCGTRLIDADGGHQHPDGSTCPKVGAWPAPAPRDPASQPGLKAAEPSRNPHDTDTDTDEGDTMTDATTAATGDAHDVESALNECNLLGDDLTRIDTALDVIDEAITNAGHAAEKIEAFLASKNVDDCAVGGMATARDMLSPERIKTLIDAIAAAKAGVQAAEEELRRLQELESQLNGADGSVLNGR